MLIHFCRDDSHGKHHSGCVMADCVLVVQSDGKDSHGVPMTTVVPCCGERFNVAKTLEEVIAEINKSLPDGVPGLVAFGELALMSYNVVGIERKEETVRGVDDDGNPFSVKAEHSIVNMQGGEAVRIDAPVAKVYKMLSAAL